MVQVHVISGFLGAGKTTFIKKILKTFSENEKVVILENEFGEEGVDGDIIQGEGFDVIQLEQGCICCSLKINFKEAIANIINDFNPCHIIIEPTGLGLLSEIINILNQIKDKCRISSRITIIDSINYMDELDGFGDFFQDQIRNAGTLILSKTQGVSSETIDKILYSLKEINANAYIVTEQWNYFSKETLRALLKDELNSDCINLSKFCGENIINDMNSVSFKVKNQISKEKLQKILCKLKSGYCGEVIRGKGFIKSNDGILQFDYVNGQYIINRAGLEEREKVCFIGKDLNRGKIHILFNDNSEGKFANICRWR